MARLLPKFNSELQGMVTKWTYVHVLFAIYARHANKIATVWCTMWEKQFNYLQTVQNWINFSHPTRICFHWLVFSVTHNFTKLSCILLLFFCPPTWCQKPGPVFVYSSFFSLTHWFGSAPTQILITHGCEWVVVVWWSDRTSRTVELIGSWTKSDDRSGNHSSMVVM